MLISVLLIVVETIIDKVEDCSVNYYAAGVQRGEKKKQRCYFSSGLQSRGLLVQHIIV